MPKKFLSSIIGILLIGVTVLIFFGGDLVRAQTKQQLCAQYSADQNTYECCMTHTSQNFEECFSETEPPSEQLPDVPDVGEGVCAWRDANGQRCDESFQRCAQGCPPRNNGSTKPKTSTPTLTPKKAAVPGPITKKFAALEEIAIPITPDRIVDFDGNELALEDVLRAGIDDTMPVAKFEFNLTNIKAGQPIHAVFSAGSPEALPLQGIIFTPTKDIDDGSLAVSIVEGSKPQLLGPGAPGWSDYNRPEQNIAKDWIKQSIDRYHLKYVIGADAKIGPPGTGYEAIPISEVLFKMVTSFLPAREGFDNPETEVVLLHLNKDKNKWDPLVTEKGTECLFDNNLCTFTALSKGFSVFAIALKKPSEVIIFLWVLLVIFWITAMIFFYRKFWKRTDDKLKAASKSEKVEIIKAVGFFKYVFIQGFLLGNAVAILTTLINVFRNKITSAKFIDIYLTDLAVGIIAGIILWFLSTRKPKKSVN